MIREKLDFFFFVLYSYYANMTSRIKQLVWYRALLSVGLCLFQVFFAVVLVIKATGRDTPGRMIWILAMIISLLIPYQLFISRQRYSAIYQKFKDSPINNPSNRAWCWIICAFMIITPYILAIIFKVTNQI
ncbi:hypothetical protein SAMN05216436_1552 [bacterium A37T11]|nr:hypothetical protein SAMN05216436_1552 [bacterium A37T11]